EVRSPRASPGGRGARSVRSSHSRDSSMAIDALAQKKTLLATASGREHRLFGRPCRPKELLQLADRLAVERVEDPAPLPSVAHQPHLLERPQMVRQERLTGLECVLKLADAPLTAGQEREDAQALLIGDRLELAQDQVE